VLQKARQHGADPELVARLLASFGLDVASVLEADAVQAAALWRIGASLSLADRLCLALGMRLGAPVATGDVAWEAVPDGPELIVIS
jgi:PIN domain nuclease of toxin-antitoxin system